MLLTRECNHNPRFAVLVKPTENTGYKAVKIVVPDYEIEITPVLQNHWFSWGKTADVRVRVNRDLVQFKSQNSIDLTSKDG
jgi:hypothetical protein